MTAPSFSLCSCAAFLSAKAAWSAGSRSLSRTRSPVLIRNCAEKSLDMLALSSVSSIAFHGGRHYFASTMSSKELLMPKLTLYHASPSRSSVALWMLEETGEPYDIHLLNLSKGDQLKPEYLAINPMGKVPALKTGDVVITEVAAICAYLADEFPKAKLNIPVGDPRRGLYFKWLFFAPSVMEPAANDQVFPRKEAPRAGAIGYRDLDTVLDFVAKAVTPGPYLLGAQFTAADVVVGSLIRWGMLFGFVPKRTEFVDYTARFAERPTAKRAAAKDQELAAKAG